MRYSAFLLTFIAVIVLSAGIVHAQTSEEVAITVFRDSGSLTIYVPEQGEISLNGLTLEIVRQADREQQLITRPIQSFPAFRTLPFDSLATPLCLRLERNGTEVPVPPDCTTQEIHVQSLGSDDALWYDTETSLNQFALLKSGSNILGYVCAQQCDFIYTPATFTTPALIPGCQANIEEHEVLVLIGKFDDAGEALLDPQSEWETILNDSVAEAGINLNVRVLLLENVILKNHDEARTYSDLCQATLVIWGEVAETGIRSAYTISQRWGQVTVQPLRTNAIAENVPQLPDLEIILPSFDTYRAYLQQLVTGQLAYLGGHYDEAIVFFEQARLLAPDNQAVDLGVASSYFYSGYVRQESERNPVAAIADYNRAIELDPDDAAVYYNRGNAHVDQGNPVRAIADYSHALELDPDNAAAYYNRGYIQQNQGDLAAAIADYSQTLELDSAYATVYYNRGGAFYDQGNPVMAIADYSRALELDPDNVTIYNKRGHAYRAQGDPVMAIADYSRVIELEPDNAAAYRYRGIAYRDEGDLEAAIADYSHALELEPDNAATYRNRGIVYREQGDLEAAIVDYSRALDLEPDNASIYRNRGVVYREQGDLEAAITDYSHALELEPDNASVYYQRGVAYSDQGDFEAAITDYDRVISLDPQNVRAYRNLGNIYYDRDEAGLALENYRRYLELADDEAAPTVVRRVEELEAASGG